jgi:hypothetical protein
VKYRWDGRKTKGPSPLRPEIPRKTF